MTDEDLARRLRAAANKASEWTTERDRLITEAVAAGNSLRTIGAVAGMSHQSVKNIARRAR